MKVKIIAASTKEEVAAEIKEGKISELPSMHENWRFNFDKEIKKIKNATGYLLVTEENPKVIEGCMIFQLKDKMQPWMAFLEVAPHNKTDKKKYDHVAGCLIAFAFKLSVTEGVGDYNSYLQFKVSEQSDEDQLKLMAVYSSKYNAVQLNETTMLIADDDGEALVEKYLRPKTEQNEDAKKNTDRKDEKS